MVEHEVSVETTQVETDTVRFCDYCGSPEEQVESLETLFTVDNGPKVYERSPNYSRERIVWSAGTDRRFYPTPDDEYRVEYDTTGIADACERCLDRLGEGEVPNPGTVHRNRTASSEDTSADAGRLERWTDRATPLLFWPSLGVVLVEPLAAAAMVMLSIITALTSMHLEDAREDA